MHQTTRLFYLKEMGIEPWFPAMLLANAPEPTVSQDIAPSQTVLSEVEQLDSVPSGEGVRLEERQDAHLQVPSIALETAVGQPKETTVLKSQPVVRHLKTKPIKFALGLYAIGDSLVVSTLMPTYEHYEAPALSLIQSILKTFCSEEPTLTHHHVINWPFFQNDQADQGKEAARDYVQNVSGLLVENHGLKRTISFGGVLPTLYNWVTEEGLSVPENTLALPSVYKMMDHASEKAKAWQIIKRSPFYAANS